MDMTAKNLTKDIVIPRIGTFLHKTELVIIIRFQQWEYFF
jgi:hypothetical protein